MSTPEAVLFEELRPHQAAPAQTLGERLWAAAAWVGLVIFDVLMKALTFRRFHDLVRRFPTLRAKSLQAGSDTVEGICSAVDRAAVFYFKRAWCLQRSALTTCLLRLRGVPAEMVIGVQKMPFAAHAWVEREGQVLNDLPMVQKRFVVLERC